MKFKNETLIERELQIARLMMANVSVIDISLQTGLNKKHLSAHIKNIMKKMGVEVKSKLLPELKRRFLDE